MLMRHLIFVLCGSVAACGHRPQPMGERLLPNGLGRLTDAGPLRGAPERCAPLVWTAAQWQAAFEGTGLSIRARCLPGALGHQRCGGALDVEVDDAQVAPIFVPQSEGASIDVVSGLPWGQHRVLLRRRNEAQLGTICVCDAQATGGAVLPPPEAPRRTLLIIGDSVSAGYGNLCQNVAAGDPLLLQDGTQTYGSIAARATGAQVRVIAWSGKGLWRNGDGTLTQTLPDLWDAIHRGVTGPQALDAVVVNLGTNDLRRMGVDEDAFVRRYVAFVNRLAAAYPWAHFFLAVGPMLSKDPEQGQQPINGESCGLRLIANTLQRLKEGRGAHDNLATRLHLLRFAPQDGSMGFGCDYHPNIATHRQMAQVLHEALTATLGW